MSDYQPEQDQAPPPSYNEVEEQEEEAAAAPSAIYNEVELQNVPDDRQYEYQMPAQTQTQTQTAPERTQQIVADPNTNYATNYATNTNTNAIPGTVVVVVQQQPLQQQQQPLQEPQFHPATVPGDDQLFPVNRSVGNVYEDAITDEQRSFENNPPSKHITCGVLTLVFWALLIAFVVKVLNLIETNQLALLTKKKSKENADDIGIAALVFYILYIVEYRYRSSTRRYLANIESALRLRDYNAVCKAAAPAVRWHIVCYHNTSSGTGNHRSTRRVVTHTADLVYAYHHWRDVSPVIVEGEDTAHAITKLQYKKTLVFADDFTAGDYNAKKHAFIAANKRDTHQTFSMDMHITDDWRTRMLCEGYPGAIGCMISSRAFAIFTLLSLSWFYRKWLDGRCARKAHTFVKEIKVVPNVYT